MSTQDFNLSCTPLWHHYINFGEVVDPRGITVPACGAPTLSGNGCCVGRANISSRRKSKLRKPENRREAAESNNICSNIFDHPCYCAEMGHGCQRRIKHGVVVWVSGISDGPVSPRCQHRADVSKLKCFSAEELRSFLAFSTSLLIYDDWLCLTSRLEFLFCCLGETKGYFTQNTSPLPRAM